MKRMHKKGLEGIPLVALIAFVVILIVVIIIAITKGGVLGSFMKSLGSTMRGGG